MLPLWGVVIALEGVVIVGTAFLFLLARRFGARLLERLTAGRPRLVGQVERARSILDRRGRAGVVVGRATPGLRTVTVLVAALSRMPAGAALAALIAGGTIFVQGHVLLGYVVGPPARAALEEAPILGLAVIAILVVAGLALWLARRGRHGGVNGWSEGTCPACLALGLGERREHRMPAS